MAKKNTTSDNAQLTEARIKKQRERDILDSWHPHIENAMRNLHSKFQADTKFMLTESDLKCWLFYYLQQEKPYTPFAVNTEVTHYAEHIVKDEKTKQEITEKKHKFRDLSLLCPWEINANEEFLNQEGATKKILSKGFRHNANAIHFELKFIRETGSNNEINGLKADIEKLKEYKPNHINHIRDFVIVCGSRSERTKVESLKKVFEGNDNENLSDFFKEGVRFYLFDIEKIVCLKFGKNGEIENVLD
jgi:hypothetical protein